MIAGNWKMHKTVPEAVRLAKQIKVLATDEVRRVEAVVCPPFTALFSVGEALKGSGIQLGAQNVYWEEEGAYTGEVAPGMLKDLGCQYVIVGHSERRTYFNETDDDVRKKVEAALNRGLSVIACVGESLEERERDETEQVLQREVTAITEGLTLEDESRLVIAYEPIWAIGTGETATKEQAGAAASFIRALLRETLGEASGDRIRILYGGSVKPENIAELMEQPDIDGALVGGASLDASSFSEIIKGS